MRTPLLAVALVALAPLAGCVTGGPSESQCEALAFETIHYDRVLEPDPLRDELTSRGYEWESRTDRIIDVRPPREMASRASVVISLDPGSSAASPAGPARGTIVTVQQSQDEPGSEGSLGDIARDLADAVNSTYAQPPGIDVWVRDSLEQGQC